MNGGFWAMNPLNINVIVTSVFKEVFLFNELNELNFFEPAGNIFIMSLKAIS